MLKGLRYYWINMDSNKLTAIANNWPLNKVVLEISNKLDKLEIVC